MAIDTVIKNGKIVTPQGIYSAGIGVDKEKIVAITGDEHLPQANKVIDAGGNHVNHLVYIAEDAVCCSYTLSTCFLPAGLSSLNSQAQLRTLWLPPKG